MVSGVGVGTAGISGIGVFGGGCAGPLPRLPAPPADNMPLGSGLRSEPSSVSTGMGAAAGGAAVVVLPPAPGVVSIVPSSLGAIGRSSTVHAANPISIAKPASTSPAARVFRFLRLRTLDVQNA
jgi:hypothetical protein